MTAKAWDPTACFACRRSASVKQGGRDFCLECSYVPDLSSKPLDAYEQTALWDAGTAGGGERAFG